MPFDSRVRIPGLYMQCGRVKHLLLLIVGHYDNIVGHWQAGWSSWGLLGCKYDNIVGHWQAGWSSWGLLGCKFV